MFVARQVAFPPSVRHRLDHVGAGHRHRSVPSHRVPPSRFSLTRNRARWPATRRSGTMSAMAAPPESTKAVGVGALYTPGTSVPTRLVWNPQPPHATSQWQRPWTPVLLPSSRAGHNEASSRVHGHSSVRPSPSCSSRMERESLGAPPSFTPRRYRQRMSGWGQAMGTCPSYVTITGLRST
jgi:hypothetical protein